MNKSIACLILFMIWIGCQPEKFSQGKAIYESVCLNCHMEDGNGLGKLYPAILDSPYLMGDFDDLVCLIRHGKRSGLLSTVYMPGHKDMTQASMTNLINYLSHTWGNKKTVTLAAVTEAFDTCKE